VRMLQVYTGEGKGKTSAAIGGILRALGHGWRVVLVIFFKPLGSGEIEVLKKISPLICIYQIKIPHPYFTAHQKVEELKDKFKKEWEEIFSEIKEAKWDLLVLDEFHIALRDGFLQWKEVENFLKEYSLEREIITTGRGAPQELVKMADLVTDMVNVKHPFEKGVRNREGVDY